MLIKLFGHKDCHKTKIYHSYLQEKGSQFVFLDVHEDDAAAADLRMGVATILKKLGEKYVGSKNE
ncbi:MULTISPECIES: hypothetical protein [Acinetobacter]|uniref:hypothetical protein n=1 Tax=Acinetobacter TaxID=469 RepID=UPI001D0D9106|nr:MULTISPECIES: hypothetical protein [Acinetobacter]